MLFSGTLGSLSPICSTGESSSTMEGIQYGGEYHHYGGGCSMRTCHIIITKESGQYRTTKTTY